ncbi:MAG: cytochrome C biogenesis protein [Pedosphaera sp.]|nr:cytochrome C biogenesis protein [Pedosphaera sp.]
MKRWFPPLLTAIFAVWILSALMTKKESSYFIDAFGRLPVVFNGRVQPVDSLARNSLTQIREKDTANLEPWKFWYQAPKILSATEWLLTVMTRPEVADGWKIFRLDHPELKALLKLPEADPTRNEDGKHFSWGQFGESGFKLIEDEHRRIRQTKKDASQRTTFDSAILEAHEALTLYLRLKNTVHPQDTAEFGREIGDYTRAVPGGVTAFRNRMIGSGVVETNALTALFDFAERYFVTVRMDTPLLIPPASGGEVGEWSRMGEALLDSSVSAPLLSHLMRRDPKEALAPERVSALIREAGTRPLNPAVPLWAKMADAFRLEQSVEFNTAVAAYTDYLRSLRLDRALSKAGSEQAFNRFAPFSKAAAIYIVAFLFGCGFWFNFAEWSRRTSLQLVLLTFVVHTVGLIFRMWLEGRPPVTNLYSSAIFIGWGAVGLGLILEGFWKNAIGLAVATVIGFATQVVAHNLALSGDTMVMMEAVLDTNFWLATHVVIVTLGYASTFVAGFLAILYVILGVGTRVLTPVMGRSLARMVYGILCFATLFSFVGTVLGGIWADQSWGRFWGWDPKENGALIIVLWNVLILHARWGGMVKERGIMNLAIVGNVVTCWSWFGTNLLGIGLHSYGFMSGAFTALMVFVATQAILIGLGSLPQSMWRSFRGVKS